MLNEIAGITKNVNFDEKTSTESFFFDTNTSVEPTDRTTNSSNYSWLYDYLLQCLPFGCSATIEWNYRSWGYWTGSPYLGSNTSMWVVTNNGNIVSNYAHQTSGGFRPVITIPKTIVETIYYDTLEIKNNPVYYNPNTVPKQIIKQI